MNVTDDRWPAYAASTASVVAMPFVAWWLIGDLSEPGGTDYLFKPPHLSTASETAVGGGLMVLLLISTWMLWTRHKAWLVEDGWWKVLIRLMLAGTLVGGGFRLLTLAGGGANIGGGMVIMIGPPVLLHLGIGARAEAIRLRTGDQGWMPPTLTWFVVWVALNMAAGLVPSMQGR